MAKTLHDQVLEVLRQRVDWELSQRAWYQMRHRGLPRKRPPFPNAADMHYPLVDGQISKFKPFYYNQIFQGERIAEFIAQVPELEPMCEDAADYFNYAVRQETQFPRKILSVIDFMLLSGRGVMKVYWDPFKKKLRYDVINPLYFIVPRRADEIEEADFFVEVKHLTVGQYQREPRYLLQDDATLKRITGAPLESQQRSYDQDKAWREGLTYSVNDDEIIIWECYQKTRGGWTVTTYSPQAPELKLREPFGVPYKMNGEYFVPYESFQMEVKDEGWYSPRGLAELLAAFEASLCKLWNEKHDFMTFVNKPVFTSDDPIPPNMVNIKMGPGELLPKGVKPMVMPNIPVDIDREMQMQRQTAEQYINTPDAGVAGDELQGSKGGGQPVTARQISYQASLASNNIEMPARTFRHSVSRLFQKSWAILSAHKEGEISYISAKTRKILPQEALAESFLVTVDGSPDSWDKGKRIQRAMQRLQVFGNDPSCDHDELVKDVLTADDARLVKRIFIGRNIEQQLDGMRQALKILLMQEGYPVPVIESDDHQVAIQVDVGWLQKQGHPTMGEPVDPVAMQRVHQDIAQHFQFLKKQNPAAAKQIEQQIQQAEQQPTNVAPMPGQGQLPPAVTSQPAAMQ